MSEKVPFKNSGGGGEGGGSRRLEILCKFAKFLVVPLSGTTVATFQCFLLRTSIVLGMVVAVLTILYFTPMPDEDFPNCNRPCHTLDWPLICHVKLHIDPVTSLRRLLTNESQAPGAIYGDLVAGRDSLGPMIHVCQNDVLVVDVMNHVLGSGDVTLHFRGQHQQLSPHMDGVPMVTQCPILGQTTFQYKFRAHSAGTHLYHGFGHNLKIFGGLIVHQPDTIDPHRRLYDYDQNGHEILMGIIENGLQVVKYEKYEVEANKRYRFRIAYYADQMCPVQFEIDQHQMQIITLDGNAIKPVQVEKFVLAPGERLDFVLHSNVPNKVEFPIILRSPKCNFLHYQQTVVLHYRRKSMENSSSGKPFGKNVIFDTSPEERIVVKDEGAIMVRRTLYDLNGLENLPEKLHNIDRKIYLHFQMRKIASNAVQDEENGKISVYSTNNVTFTYPPAPLLTQFSDVPPEEICIGKDREIYRQCVHIINIELDASVELILINDENEELLFHLHGYKFYVMSSTSLPQNEEVISIGKIDRFLKDQVVENANNPILKDTIRLPQKSVTTLRFHAKNPGFWIFRDELSGENWTRGLDVIFQVGEYTQMASKPNDFPTCGNFMGPDFFLI